MLFITLHELEPGKYISTTSSDFGCSGRLDSTVSKYCSLEFSAAMSSHAQYPPK